MTGLKLNAVTHSTVARMKTRNVIGVGAGREKPDEYVLYTAHWDHLGVSTSVPGRDKIHNGAVDNATRLSPRSSRSPRRSPRARSRRAAR